MRTKRVVLGALAAAALVGGTASAASAGEITGNGELKNVPAKSICAYSGQNDGYHIPELAHDEDDAAMRVQSFGQVVKGFAAQGLVDDFAKGMPGLPPGVNGVGVPGLECNGHTNPWPPGA